MPCRGCSIPLFPWCFHQYFHLFSASYPLKNAASGAENWAEYAANPAVFAAVYVPCQAVSALADCHRRDGNVVSYQHIINHLRSQHRYLAADHQGHQSPKIYLFIFLFLYLVCPLVCVWFLFKDNIIYIFNFYIYIYIGRRAVFAK